MNKSSTFLTQDATMTRRRRIAIILILIADIGFRAWSAMAALLPEHLLGPGSKPILQAEYEGFTGLSWADLNGTTPGIANFITVLFRMYGAYCTIFALLLVFITVTAFRRSERWAWWALLVSNTLAYGSAMIFDKVVNAIGAFEMTEYLGIAAIYVALAMTAPFLAIGRNQVPRPLPD
jgi:hypothetical protein